MPRETENPWNPWRPACRKIEPDAFLGLARPGRAFLFKVRDEGWKAGCHMGKGPIVMTDVVCPHCADLCDDLRLTVEGSRIAAVEVEYPAARAFFMGYQVETVTPRVRGRRRDGKQQSRRLGCGG